MNNVNFNGYGYPDMNLINNLFLKDNKLNTNNNDLASPYEGYIRGNLYNSLYSQYKNYRPKKLIPNNEKAELLLNANQLSFAAHEIRLYLDVHPNDTSMINLYNMYQQQANDAIKKYEKKYGPILQNSSSDMNMFSWENYAWPWEMEEM